MNPSSMPSCRMYCASASSAGLTFPSSAFQWCPERCKSHPPGRGDVPIPAPYIDRNARTCTASTHIGIQPVSRTRFRAAIPSSTLPPVLCSSIPVARGFAVSTARSRLVVPKPSCPCRRMRPLFGSKVTSALGSRSVTIGYGAIFSAASSDSDVGHLLP